MSIERKITKIGKSYGVTLPVDMLAEHGIEYGDILQVKKLLRLILLLLKARKNTKH